MKPSTRVALWVLASVFLVVCDAIAQEKGALGIDVLRAIKRTLDHKGILNPGKLLPPG